MGNAKRVQGSGYRVRGWACIFFYYVLIFKTMKTMFLVDINILGKAASGGGFFFAPVMGIHRRG